MSLNDQWWWCFIFYELQKSGDYLAIPITINVVLIISDTLLIWASASKNKLLLWPWIILHLLEFLFFISMLILLMVIVPEPWFKVVVFLVGSPVIVLLVSILKSVLHSVEISWFFYLSDFKWNQVLVILEMQNILF